ISGASATTTDSTASLIISMNPKNLIDYDFNEVKVFTAPHADMYEILPTPEMGDYTVSRVDSLGYISFKFARYQKVASFRLHKSNEYQRSFTLYGFSLENDNPGITYHAIGINGASLGSWLGCEHFYKQLQFLNPDWIVIFLGVNDGNTANFDPEVFYANYDSFLSRILQYNPNTLFTFIVPNDYYLFRRRPNPAVEKEQVQMMRLVEKYGGSLYSIYDVMGGFGTSNTWVSKGFMAYDKIHMTVSGYVLTANLFFNAFLHSYDNYLQNKEQKN
ncbi:MAG: GDSL-type esterase/lipase family protein, partial [Bacteroidales bacterium]|nr:GDSL-type esterase/lipase family protein [Bacteroidales bacterium]